MSINLRAVSPRLLATATAATCVVAAAATMLAAGPAGAATGRPTVRMHVTKSHHVSAPSKLHPGVAKFTNTGKRPIVILSKKSKGLSTLQADLAAANSKHGSTAVLRDFAIRDELIHGQSAYLGLKRGTLYLVDGGSKITKSIHVVHVTGSTRNAPLPASRTFSLTRAHGLSVESPVPHGAVVHVVNKTASTQFVVSMQVSDKVSDADIAAFNAKPSESALGKLHPVNFAALAILSGHRSLWAVLPNTRSVYVVSSFAFTSVKSAGAARYDMGMFSAQ